MQDFWSLEVIMKDLDTDSPDDLIDIIFACNAYEANNGSFSDPQTFIGAIRIASITLSFLLHCDDDSENCSNAFYSPSSNATDSHGDFIYTRLICVIRNTFHTLAHTHNTCTHTHRMDTSISEPVPEF